MQRHHPKLEPTRDHYIPKSKGGWEIIICCLQCNAIKADRSPAAWAAFMVMHPQWWLLTKYELRAIFRKEWRNKVETEHPLLAGPSRQGSPKPGPVVVPPELIFPQD